MMYQRLSSLIPKRIARPFENNLRYLNISISAKRFLGFLLFFSLLVSFGIGLFADLILEIPIYLVGTPLFFIIFIAVYAWLSLTADSEGKFVDNVLPSALQLIASNIKGGLTTEKALFSSAKPEFGPLERELKKASKSIVAGKRIEKALLEVGNNIKSRNLKRTMWLISEGISSGGQIVDLLMQLSQDLTKENSIKQEVKANISIYFLLIFFSSAIGGPLLISISTFVVEAMGSQAMAMFPQTFTANASSLPISIGLPDVDFVVGFGFIVVIVTAFFSSLILGVINSGRERAGLKYLPFLLLIAVTVFFLSRHFLGVFFSSFI